MLYSLFLEFRTTKVTLIITLTISSICYSQVFSETLLFRNLREIITTQFLVDGEGNVSAEALTTEANWDVEKRNFRMIPSNEQ